MSDAKYVVRSKQLAAPIPVDFEEADGSVITVLFASPALGAMDSMAPRPGRTLKVSQYMFSLLVECALPNQPWITVEWFKERVDMRALPVIWKLLAELVPNEAEEDEEAEAEEE
jgi:hypothetical protein